MSRASSHPLLELQAVEKSFGGIPALKALNLTIHPGEVLGLIGENGAGKSTLIKLLSGVHSPDAGLLRWQGAPATFDSPHEALAAGIGTIHQELAYCGSLTVAENFHLGDSWPRRAWGGVDWNQLMATTRHQLSQFGLELDPSKPFHQLTTAQKQEVAIARAISRQVRLLILDEPTASLSEPEVERLFIHLERLRQTGVALLYVSHRLDEILRLTDRVAVLRDGEMVAGYPTREATVPRLIQDMVGRALPEWATHPSADHYEAQTSGSRAVLLSLEAATCRGLFENMTFEVREGEIVGLAGLVGAGRSELARAIYGLYPLSSGSMRFQGKPWAPTGPAEALQSGLAYLPEERKRQSLVLDHSVADSISIGFSDLLARWGWIPQTLESEQIQRAIHRFGVKTSSTSQPIGTLSGGNQQKVILARWLDRDPSLILLDEPTRGVDVGAKAEIHQLIRQLAARGKGVLLISSDLPEVLSLSGRILVMHHGRLAAELIGANRTQENVLLAASGEEIASE